MQGGAVSICIIQINGLRICWPFDRRFFTALTVQDADVVTLALEAYRARPSLGFSDCLVLETARRAGHHPLGTFDKNLAKLDGALGLSTLPEIHGKST
jgi:predicted nucleic acid-binding protein